jgi:hypothetical protein
VEHLEPLADVEMHSEDEDYLPSRKEKQNLQDDPDGVLSLI